MPDVNIITFNVRGLRNVVKRRTIFRFLHQWYPRHVVVLQETHSDIRSGAMWQAEWGSPILYSHGPSTSESGVAVLLPRALLSCCDVDVVSGDTEGRLLIVEFKFRLVALILCALYAPTQGHGQQQLEFFKKVQTELDMVVNGETNVVLCGDLNVHLSDLDTQNRFRLSPSAKQVIELSQDFNLVDVWRDKYKDRRQYTWRRFNPVQQSRIDYVFANENLLHSSILKRIEIKPGVCSDHSLVNFELEMCNSDKGRGLFRFDNGLLEDQEFVDFSRAEIVKANEGQGIYQDVSDVGLKIEMLSSEIRVKSIKLASWKARQRRESERILLEKIESLEVQLGIHDSAELVREYTELKERLEQLEERRGRMAMLHSGARWLELGEKPTRYFLKMNAASCSWTE